MFDDETIKFPNSLVNKPVHLLNEEAMDVSKVSEVCDN